MPKAPSTTNFQGVCVWLTVQIANCEMQNKSAPIVSARLADTLYQTNEAYINPFTLCLIYALIISVLFV